MTPRTKEQRFAFLDTIRELPSLPQVIVGISRVAANPGAGAQQLAEVILKDQALTMKVLRIGNSAQYAVCSQRVTTVSRAVVMLGFESVRALALGLGAFNLLSSLEKGGHLHEDFWKNSMAVAVACQELAGLVGIRTVEEAFVAGLLHDVGKLILTEVDVDKAQQVYGAGLEGTALLRAETEAFGVDHAEVAGELARRWELPPVLQRAMEHHHRPFSKVPEDPGERLAFLVGVAKTLTGPLRQESCEPRALAAQVARLVRKPVGTVLGEIRNLPDKIREYAGFFEIQLDDLKEYTLWLEEEHQRLFEATVDREGGRREEERRQAELATMRDIHGLILEGADGEAVGRRVLRGARAAAGSRRCVLALVNPDRTELRATWGDGDVTPQFLGRFRFPLREKGILASTVAGGEPVNVFDTALPFFSRLLGEREAAVLDVASFAAFPLRRGGTVVGVLYGDRDPGDEPFSDAEAETLGSLADLLSLALGRGGEPGEA
ncbi:MAG: HDOD domain-containing protein [Deferrisomatales bacterium]|nr:HDOD domain-containing protein [Deferrisomatales bacterium]